MADGRKAARRRGQNSVKMSFSDCSITANQKLDRAVNAANQPLNAYYKKDKLHHAKTFRIPSIPLRTTKPQERKAISLPYLLTRFVHPQGQSLHKITSSPPPPPELAHWISDITTFCPITHPKEKGSRGGLRDTSTFQTAGVQAKGRHQQYLFRIPLFKEHIHIHQGWRGGEGKLASAVVQQS